MSARKLAMSGSLESVFLADILAVAATTPKFVCVELGEPEEILGSIWLFEGLVVDADSPLSAGRKAFMEIFRGRKSMSGPFRIYYLEDEPPSHNIGILNHLLLEAAQIEDEGREQEEPQVRAEVIPLAIQTKAPEDPFPALWRDAVKAMLGRDLSRYTELVRECHALRPSDARVLLAMQQIKVEASS